MKSCPICDTAYPNDLATCSKDGAVLVPNPELEPGTVIRGKYRIVRTLGRGGMGTVYLAEHLLLGRLRALKFISGHLSRDPRFLKRFRQEAQTAIELRHPNIAEVADLDQAEDGTPYIAMEFVDGPDLRNVLRAGPLPVERAIAIASGIAQGLAAAHARGVIHRDLKPENILLAGQRGAAEQPKLVDFGIAAINDAAGSISRTQALMLTPEYASPEQWRGTPARELDGRADLYSLGVLTYEMLTGRNPFQAENAEGWMYQHLQFEPPRPSLARPEIAEWPGMDQAVLQLLVKDRDRRTADASAAIQALQSLRRVQATEPDKPPKPRRTHRFTHPEKPVRLSAPAQNPVPDAEEDSFGDEQKGGFRWLLVCGIAAAVVLAVALAVSVAIPASSIYTVGRKLHTPRHPGLSILLYQVACSRGSGEACLSLGLDYYGGADGNADGARAADYFSRACLDGEAAGCDDAGQTFELGQGLSVSYTRAVNYYTRACGMSDPLGCASLGRMYERGSGVAQDYPHAVALFAQACEQGNSDGCEGLARSYRDGHGVDADLTMAKSLFDKAQTLSAH